MLYWIIIDKEPFLKNTQLNVKLKVIIYAAFDMTFIKKVNKNSEHLSLVKRII